MIEYVNRDNYAVMLSGTRHIVTVCRNEAGRVVRELWQEATAWPPKGDVTALQFAGRVYTLVSQMH